MNKDKYVINSERPHWFNADCKQATDTRLMFLEARRSYCVCKRTAKYNYNNKEQHRLKDMSRSDSRNFWKYIKKFKGGNKNQANINLNDFLTT